PDFYDLSVYNKNKNINYTPTIYIDDSPINIQYKFKLINKNYAYNYPTVISESSVQNDLSHFMQLRDSCYQLFKKKIESLKIRFMNSMNNDRLMNILADSLKHIKDYYNYYHKRAIKHFVNNNPSSLVAPFKLLEIINHRSNLLYLQKLYNELDEKVANSKYGKLCKERILKYMTHNTEFLDDTIQYLHGNQPDGSKLYFKNILNRNKVVLIDFWASWCGGCRLEMSGLNKVYENFHTKGFDIIAVSLDQNRENW